MTTVDPRDLKPGDKVRVSFVRVGTVAAVDPGKRIDLEDGQWFLISEIHHDARTWELLDRPKPKLGSLWLGPKGTTVWASTESGAYPFIQIQGDAIGSVLLAHDDCKAIARLVPYTEESS